MINVLKKGVDRNPLMSELQRMVTIPRKQHGPSPAPPNIGTTNKQGKTQGIQTDREVLANRPDIMVRNKKDKTCLLIDVAIPSDKNVIQKEAEKKLKYKNLSIEIQRMWIVKCFVIPVIIGATGIVSKS
jgi:hypothetical protein